MTQHETSGAAPARLLSFQDAAQAIIAHALPLGTESVGLARADGRILAAPVIARRTSPPALMSAMDGYAVRDADVAQLPVTLKIAGKSFAGAGFDAPLPAGACVRIFTGAPAPDGTGRVILQEDVHSDGQSATFSRPPAKARHLRAPGSDFTKGDTIVPAGRLLLAQHLVGIAAADVAAVSVFRQPRLAILCCGDELAEPGHGENAPDRIPESISWGVAAMARRWGAGAAERQRLPDDPALIRAAAMQAADGADVLVVIGGASVGEHDFAKQAFAPLGLELLFSKVAIKPGKPVWFGRAGKTLVVGLPGNPTSALVTARLFLAPLLAGLSGGNCRDALDWRMRTAAAATGAHSDRDQFIRAIATPAGVMALPDQDSAGQKALADATLLVWHERDRPPAAPNSQIRTLLF